MATEYPVNGNLSQQEFSGKNLKQWKSVIQAGNMRGLTTEVQAGKATARPLVQRRSKSVRQILGFERDGDFFQFELAHTAVRPGFRHLLGISLWVGDGRLVVVYHLDGAAF